VTEAVTDHDLGDAPGATLVGDDDALGAVRGGDTLAFARLYREVHPRLLRFLRVRAPAHAEDVASDTWLEVVRSLHRFSGDESAFRAWVFAIARHRLVDALRRDARRPLRLVDDAHELERLGTEALQGLEDPVLASAEQEDATKRAIALVRTLPPDQADVVMLRVVAGFDTIEIASLLGKTPGAVRVLAHRGLRRLQRVLELQGATAADLAAGRVPAVTTTGDRSIKGSR
jgi:RNA polymerase sigma-70 factor (ECF subfamily)